MKSESDCLAGLESPIAHSSLLNRLIRSDGVETLGISTQVWIESRLVRGDFDDAEQLVDYHWQEMRRIGEVLYGWLEDIFDEVLGYEEFANDPPVGARLLRGLRSFDIVKGERERALRACKSGDAEAARAATEAIRKLWVGPHDALVRWIHELLSDLAATRGEEAVLVAVERAYDRAWRQRYLVWDRLTPLERLQLSVEGMRGHLSGPRRRGDIGVVETDEFYQMVLDPCGSCGIMRRGDPESGRPPLDVDGNKIPHPWTWNRTGVGWYASHSPMVMEFFWTREGLPPMRPLRGCDMDAPCNWYIFKDQSKAIVMDGPPSD